MADRERNFPQVNLNTGISFSVLVIVIGLSFTIGQKVLLLDTIEFRLSAVERKIDALSLQRR